jgi:hypothetical protein
MTSGEICASVVPRLALEQLLLLDTIRTVVTMNGVMDERVEGGKRRVESADRRRTGMTVMPGGGLTTSMLIYSLSACHGSRW